MREQQAFLGLNSISNLKTILEKENPNKVLLVMQEELYKASGASSILPAYFKDIEVEVFSDIKSNPEISQIERAIDFFKKANPDVVVALGGGSVLDTAKGMNVLSQQKGDIADFVKGVSKIEGSGKSLIAIPTTAGTGSEATPFSVVYIDKTKYSLSHVHVRPDYAIVDAHLTYSMPERVAASTAMDALSQAIEAFWSVNATEESKQHSREAIKLILRNIVQSVYSPKSKAREAVSLGAYLSGKAIAIAQTTACHAISYPITSYFGVLHGHAVALTLPQMILFNSEVNEEDCADVRGKEYVNQTMKELLELLEVSSAEKAKQKIENIMSEIKLEKDLASVGIITDENREIIIQNGFNPQRMKNNPRKVTEEALRTILETI